MSTAFIEWLDQQERTTGLSDYVIAKRGKFSHSALSRARTGISPGFEICVRLSKVLNVSPITVFRKAGLLQDGPEEEITWDDWQYLLAQMTPAERDEMREIGIMKIERRQKAEASARAAQFKPEKQNG
jgi:transcriptional regulator with XRE-family HTH domain